MTSLSESYVHLKPFRADGRIEELGELAVALGTSVARQVYDFDVDLEVRIEPGSLKAWVVIIGSLSSLYYGVAAWPDFKQGVVELVEDARVFAGSFNEQFIDGTGANPNQVYRTERRTMTPGKLIRCINRVEHPYSSEDYQRALHELRVILNELPQRQSRPLMRMLDETFPRSRQMKGAFPSAYTDVGTEPGIIHYTVWDELPIPTRDLRLIGGTPPAAFHSRVTVEAKPKK